MESSSPIDLAGLQGPLQTSNQLMGRLINTLQRGMPAPVPYYSALSISYSSNGGTTVAVGPGVANGAGSYLCSIFVTTASSGTAIIYDANSPSNVGSSNIMALIPSSGSQVYNIPFVNGLTIQPSSINSHRVSVYYINQTATGQ